MMEKMNKWLSAHKQLCVITGIFGLLVSPFLWPVFLAVIIQSLSLVIPVAAGLFFYEKFIMKKDKEETNENDDNPTPTDKGKRLKIFYGTQVSVKPPTFVIFVNEEELMHFSYMRFLENQIRQAFGFEGTPIHLIARKRK